MTKEDYKDFLDFLCASDRKSFIQDYLNEGGIDAPVIQKEGKSHIYVKFPLEQYNPLFKIKTVIAHYDVFPGSPGANDNSFAVFVLMLFARQLIKISGTHNIRIIFTDGEESGDDGITEQGAFSLAQTFKKLGITEDEVYVFDCMGRGSIPIICENPLPEKLPSKLAKGLIELENKTEKLLKSASGGKWFKIPCSYSDNAGFIVNGIPAIAVSMLPSDEVNEYLHSGLKPKTWEMLHCKEDNAENLTVQSFELFFKILILLSNQKTLR